jgi:hypothetical protein
VAAWAAQGRTQTSWGEVRDNSASWQKVLRGDSLKRGVADALADEAERNWDGDIVCAVLEAQDGNVSGISRIDASKFFPEGWQYPPLTEAEKLVEQAAEAASKLEVAQSAIAYAAKLAEPKRNEVNAPHSKYDDNLGNGVW